MGLARDEGEGTDVEAQVGVGKGEGAAEVGRRRGRGGKCTSCRCALATRAPRLLFEPGMLEFML